MDSLLSHDCQLCMKYMQAIKLSPNQVSCPHSLCSPEHQTATGAGTWHLPMAPAGDVLLAVTIMGSINNKEIISIFSAAVWREIILEEPNELALPELSALMRRSGNVLRKRGCFSKKCGAFIESLLLWVFKDPLFFSTAIYFLSDWRTKTITNCTNFFFPLSFLIFT